MTEMTTPTPAPVPPALPLIPPPADARAGSGAGLEPAVEDTARVKVRATQVGFYDEKRRRTGDVFTLLAVEHLSTTWMQIVPGSTPERITSGQQELRRLHDELIAARGAIVASDTPITDADSLADG